MSVRFIWAVILILLGAATIVGGFLQLGELYQWHTLVAGSAGTLDEGPLVDIAKIAAIFRLLLGTGLAFWGTWLILDAQFRPAARQEEPLPQDGFRNGRLDEANDRPPASEQVKEPAIFLCSDPAQAAFAKACCGSCRQESSSPPQKSGRREPCPPCRVLFEVS